MTALTLDAICSAERRRASETTFRTARETFTFLDTIGPVTIDRGEEVHPTHPAVLKHPDKFESPPGTRRNNHRPELNAMAVPAAQRQPKGLPSWQLGPPQAQAEEPDVVLRDGFSKLSVSFLSTAEEAIRIEAAAFRSSGLETGGQLFAHADHTWSWAPRVHFVRASGPGANAKHAAARLDRDASHEIMTAREIAGWSGGKVREAGHWHVHPGGTDVPSPPDLIAWTKLLELTGLSRFVGVIVNHEPKRMSAWVLRHNDCGCLHDCSYHPKYICQRATVDQSASGR